MEQKQSLGAKIFTIAFCVLLVALLGVSIFYLTTGEDFFQPLSLKIDNDCKDYTLDEFAAYLTEQGRISAADYTKVASETVTEARKYGDTVLTYVDPEGDKAAAWQTSANIGNATLEDGTWLVVYGPFGISGVDPDNTEDVTACLEQFPAAYSGNHGNKTAWDCTFEEFEAYMIDKGFFNHDTRKLMSTMGTLNYIYDGIDTMWWDVENLDEDSLEYENWEAFNEDGYIIFGGTVYMPQFNGPFAIYVTGSCPHSAEAVYEAFANFPQK